MTDGTLEQRVMGAEQLMTAKITEFAAHLTAGDRSAADRARTAAIAALEVHLDLTDQIDHADFRVNWLGAKGPLSALTPMPKINP